MLINNPCIITPRLMAGIKIGQAYLSIGYAKRPADGHRCRYQYHIDHPDWTHSDDDLQSGCNHCLQHGLSSLLSFLDACGEGYRYNMSHPGQSENANLFPEHVAEWCYLNEDELGMMSIELEESADIIQE